MTLEATMMPNQLQSNTEKQAEFSFALADVSLDVTQGGSPRQLSSIFQIRKPEGRASSSLIAAEASQDGSPSV